MFTEYLKNEDSYRCERKFIVSELTKHQIEQIVKFNPEMFSEIYYQRFVNNLYLDTFNRKSYFDAVNGVTVRVKVRIRWYGDLFGKIKNPILEFKIKKGLWSSKKLFSLDKFSINNDLELDGILNILKKSNIPDILKLNLNSLEFSLLNRYKRKYFLSADSNYRITIDSEMEYYQLKAKDNNFLCHTTDSTNTILELKYEQKQDESADKITNFFPFRMTKSSKYINGIERLNLW
ncbi:VTC domain-containing protein [bacterium]|nr:VTC domain-containing protein [bacterium]